MTTTQTLPELFHLDPNTLTIAKNARVDVKLDPEFVASIKERGVIEPLIAHRDEVGSVVVRAGQRRTLAAREAGCVTVPVLITEAPTDEAEQIVEQVEENDRRQAMSSVDRVNVAEQLALLGYTPAQIAKRTRRERGEVDAALAVGRSAASRARVAEGLDLVAAAALAEFEDDPEAVVSIEHTIRCGYDVKHTLARLRNDREEAVILAEAIEKVHEVTGAEAVPFTYERAEVATLAGLRNSGGRHVSKSEHIACPGNVAMIRVNHRPDRESGSIPYEVILGCRDYKSHGHTHIYDVASAPEEPTVEDRATVIEGNKLWRAAEEVRREWLAQLCKGSKLPRGAEVVMASQLAQGRVGDATGWSLLTGQGKSVGGVRSTATPWPTSRS